MAIRENLIIGGYIINLYKRYYILDDKIISRIFFSLIQKNKYQFFFLNWNSTYSQRIPSAQSVSKKATIKNVPRFIVIAPGPHHTNSRTTRKLFRPSIHFIFAAGSTCLRRRFKKAPDPRTNLKAGRISMHWLPQCCCRARAQRFRWNFNN